MASEETHTNNKGDSCFDDHLDPIEIWPPALGPQSPARQADLGTDRLLHRIEQTLNPGKNPPDELDPNPQPAPQHDEEVIDLHANNASEVAKNLLAEIDKVFKDNADQLAMLALTAVAKNN